VLPPLIVADHEISEGIERLSRALARISKSKT
jgi:acetylornithine/succinyldiaminopimelate/putrescine aminotransferase